MAETTKTSVYNLCILIGSLNDRNRKDGLDHENPPYTRDGLWKIMCYDPLYTTKETTGMFERIKAMFDQLCMDRIKEEINKAEYTVVQEYIGGTKEIRQIFNEKGITEGPRLIIGPISFIKCSCYPTPEEFVAKLPMIDGKLVQYGYTSHETGAEHWIRCRNTLRMYRNNKYAVELINKIPSVLGTYITGNSYQKADIEFITICAKIDPFLPKPGTKVTVSFRTALINFNTSLRAILKPSESQEAIDDVVMCILQSMIYD